MLGIVNARNIQIRRIAQRFGSKANLESVEKRINRFFSEVNIEDTAVALFAEKTLLLRRITEVTLVIDRTNWKYGSTHRNLLVLGILCNNQFVPLIARNLGSKRKRGNSSYQDRIDLWMHLLRHFHG